MTELNISKEAAIIDVGGGDSYFVDYLIENGYKDVTVLDISETALERAKERLGSKAQQVQWVIADASNFKSDKQYDFWYDRAAFHFLTEEKSIKNYVQHLELNLTTNAQVVIGTFSENGPKKCSGIEIKQYSAHTLEQVFSTELNCSSCQNVDHATPFDTTQNFTFCSFLKKIKQAFK